MEICLKMNICDSKPRHFSQCGYEYLSKICLSNVLYTPSYVLNLSFKYLSVREFTVLIFFANIFETKYLRIMWNFVVYTCHDNVQFSLVE